MPPGPGRPQTRRRPGGRRLGGGCDRCFGRLAVHPEQPRSSGPLNAYAVVADRKSSSCWCPSSGDRPDEPKPVVRCGNYLIPAEPSSRTDFPPAMMMMIVTGNAVPEPRRVSGTGLPVPLDPGSSRSRRGPGSSFDLETRPRPADQSDGRESRSTSFDVRHPNETFYVYVEPKRKNRDRRNPTRTSGLTCDANRSSNPHATTVSHLDHRYTGGPCVDESQGSCSAIPRLNTRRPRESETTSADDLQFRLDLDRDLDRTIRNHRSNVRQGLASTVASLVYKDRSGSTETCLSQIHSRDGRLKGQRNLSL